MKPRKAKLYGRKYKGEELTFSGNYKTYHGAIKAGKEKFGRGNYLIDIRPGKWRNETVPTREEQLPIAGTVEHVKRMIKYGLQNRTDISSGEDN